MWRTARGRSGVDEILITVVAAILFFLIASPTSAAAARAGQSRMRRVAPKAAAPAVRQPATARILPPDHEILIRLQDGQRTLEKQTADFNAAIQRQMSAEIADSKRESQQMLKAAGKRIDSTQRFLKIIVALLVLLCGGLLYVAQQLPRLEDKSIAWKGDLTAEPDDEGIVSWRKGEPLDG